MDERKQQENAALETVAEGLIRTLSEKHGIIGVHRVPESNSEAVIWRGEIKLEFGDGPEAPVSAYTLDFCLQSFPSSSEDFPTKRYLTVELYLLTGDLIPSRASDCADLFFRLNDWASNWPGIKLRVSFGAGTGGNWIIASTDVLMEAIDSRVFEMHFGRLLDFLGYREDLEFQLFGMST